jgi:hypothetical protein
MTIKYDIKWNSQRNNFNFNGTFKGYAQCFSTCSWMLMSYYSLEIDALDDKALSKYVDDVEATVGSTPGLAEEIQANDHSITGKTSLYWEVQRIGITHWLKNLKVNGKAICEYNASFNRIKEILKTDPVIIGTNKMGSLPGGHIILGIGYDDIYTIINDPFGNAVKNYTDENGESVYYEDKFLNKYFTKRILYWKS